MLIVRDLSTLKGTAPPALTLTIGNFDGVHLGHRRLIAETRALADELGIAAAALTFDPHPQELLGGSGRPELLTPLPRKLELLADQGLDLALVLSFSADLALLGPEEFFSYILGRGIDLRGLVIGHDFALGKDRRGDCAALAGIGAELDFKVSCLPAVQYQGTTISSSAIRELLRQGEAQEAAKLLGSPHCVKGPVIHGFARGRELGFPTLNVDFGQALLPASGVYAVRVRLDGPGQEKELSGVANIGSNPTFAGKAISLEAHILDFNQDVYEYTANISFIKRLRPEIRFPDAQALIAQMKLDKEEARSILQEIC